MILFYKAGLLLFGEVYKKLIPVDKSRASFSAFHLLVSFFLKQNVESRLGKEGEKKDSEFYENDTLPHVKISVLHPASLAREQGLRAFQVVVGHLCLNKQREKLGLKIRSNCVFTIGNCHISYQRYHKRPWSLRAWIDKGRSKSCIVEVGT